MSPQVGDVVLVRGKNQYGRITYIDGETVRIKFAEGRGAPHRLAVEDLLQESIRRLTTEAGDIESPSEVLKPANDRERKSFFDWIQKFGVTIGPDGFSIWVSK